MGYIDLNKLSPSQFPSAEDDQFEFKSSLATDSQIKEKLPCAVSGLANSGGGCFIWGVDKNGNADGGVTAKFGSQDRRDWLDNIIHQVESTPRYDIRLYSDFEGRGTLQTGNVIVAVSVHPSEAVPHMGHDKKYYVRAGAHTHAATHFIVEALWARRHVLKPVISHVLRYKPHYTSVVQVGIIAITNAPALDVRISFSPLKKHMVELLNDLPIQVAVVERSHPFYFDVTTRIDVVEELGDDVTLTVEYRDVSGNQYTHKNSTPLYKALQPFSIGIDDPLKKIADNIEEIKQKIDWASLVRERPVR